MKIVRIITLALLIFFFLPAYSQKNLNGYYVSASGDTVKGTFIKYDYFDMNPARVNFRTARQVSITLTPQSVKMFQVEGQPGYFAYEGLRHLDGPDLPQTKAWVFLRLVFDNAGTRLFEFTDTLRTNFYLQKNGQELEELIYSQWIENDKVFTIDSFKTQISLC